MPGAAEQAAFHKRAGKLRGSLARPKPRSPSILLRNGGTDETSGHWRPRLSAPVYGCRGWPNPTRCESRLDRRQASTTRSVVPTERWKGYDDRVVEVSRPPGRSQSLGDGVWRLQGRAADVCRTAPQLQSARFGGDRGFDGGDVRKLEDGHGRVGEGPPVRPVARTSIHDRDGR